MFITLEEAAKRLGCCVKTVQSRINSKQLPAYQFSHNFIRIDDADLTEYIDRHRTTGQGRITGGRI
jgi:excisionase family DNA binding protein